MAGKGWWTDDRVSTLKAMWLAHRTWEIGNAIGCSGNACIGKARRLGLPAIDLRTRKLRSRLTCQERKIVHPKMVGAPG